MEKNEKLNELNEKELEQVSGGVYDRIKSNVLALESIAEHAMMLYEHYSCDQNQEMQILLFECAFVAKAAAKRLGEGNINVAVNLLNSGALKLEGSSDREIQDIKRMFEDVARALLA